MSLDLKLFGADELNKAFAEMSLKRQKTVIMQGLTKAANIIKIEGLRGYQASKKSVVNKYTDKIRKSFKTKPDKKGELSVYTGSYDHRALWINSGTVVRMTKGARVIKKGVNKGKKIGLNRGRGIHTTGKMTPTYFWRDAVNAKMVESQNVILANIETNIQRIINKNNKARK